VHTQASKWPPQPISELLLSSISDLAAEPARQLDSLGGELARSEGRALAGRQGDVAARSRALLRDRDARTHSPQPE